MCTLMHLCLQGRGNGRQSAIDLKQGIGASARPGGGDSRKYPLSDSQKSSVGQAQIAAAANHQEGSKAKDRKTRGNSSHVPQEQKYKCELCNCFIVNKRDLITQHEQSEKHQRAVVAAAQKRQRWHCETCNIDFPNTPEAVSAHMESQEHARMKVYDAEQHRDGPLLAKKQRQVNADADKNTAKRQKQKK